MKFTKQQKQAIVEIYKTTKNSSLKLLKYVYINEGFLTCSNIEKTIRIMTDIDTEITTVITFELFYQKVVKKNKEFDLYEKDENTILEIGNIEYKFNFSNMLADWHEFTKDNKINDNKEYLTILTQWEIKETAKRKYMLSKDETRRVLTKYAIRDGYIYGTDGHLAFRIEQENKYEGEIIIEPETIDILKHCEHETTIYQSDKKNYYVNEEICIIDKKFDWPYVNIENIIPDGYSEYIQFGEKYKDIENMYTPGKNELIKIEGDKINSRNIDYGIETSLQNVIEENTFSGIKIGFNKSLLIKLLDQSESKKLYVRTKISISYFDDGKILTLIMPLRILEDC